MVVIRRAEEKDLGQITNLLYQVHQVHAEGRPDIFKPGMKKYSTQELRALIKDNAKPVFVAVNEADEAVGYVFCVYQVTNGHPSLTDRKVLYIDDLCVDAQHRGQHIGEKLYRFAEEEAQKNGCDSVTLQVWNLNPAAIRFYEKIGFSPLKVLMEKAL